MKKIISVIIFATCLLAVADAQTTTTAAKKRNYAKETAKMLKQLSPEGQQRVLEYAEREVKVQAAMKLPMPVAQTPVAATAARTIATPSTATTPTTAVADPHAGHNHASTTTTTTSTTALPSVTPATSANSDSPEYLVKAEQMPKTTLKWDKDSHDFGKITEGEKVSHRFTFTNTGKNPLLVTMVKPSCGCTAPKWSQEEIAPGKEGFIDLEFNSAGKSGVQRKNVSVFLNTEPTMLSLTFTGEVVPAEK